MKPETFVIKLESWKPEGDIEIPSYKEAKIIADLTNEEFLECWRPKEEQYNEYKLLKKQCKAAAAKQKLAKIKLALPNKSIPKKRRVCSERKYVTPDKSRSKPRVKQMKTSTPLIRKIQKSYGKSTVRPLSHKISQSQMEQRQKFRRLVETRNLKTIQLINNQLLDLIPPDVDALDIDMNHMMLSRASENDLSDYDSVSCSSSDGSYHTCYGPDEYDKEFIGYH